MEVFAYIAPTVTVPSDGEASSHLWTHMAADAIGYDPSFSQVLRRGRWWQIRSAQLREIINGAPKHMNVIADGGGLWFACYVWAAPLLVATHMWSCLTAAHACLPACFLVRKGRPMRGVGRRKRKRKRVAMDNIDTGVNVPLPTVRLLLDRIEE
ncbi:hypothetical protein GW17_00030792 [Ensete ventricosum]|nr:hypothetical protein GW17_00030792 [Ensete ventricosum]